MKPWRIMVGLAFIALAYLGLIMFTLDRWSHIIDGSAP